ncbi:Gp138 family membrane-puncturing spike protein [Mangrovibacter phragmitis]|uniref:Gp138 family membrane-puncturing spike protein n=1 Tax=Mangrovibacter phragmitis TaxID=1691903 RepID=UPI0035147F50
MKDSNPFLTLLMQLRPNLLWDLMFCLPGKVTSYDPNLQRAVVEIGIQRHEGEGVFETLPEIRHVPVQFSGTANWSIFHELPEGTEGLIHFSQRSVDYWLEQGGPVRPLDARMFDATDAFFSPGYRSRATSIANLPTTGIGMSNADQTINMHLSELGIKLQVGSQMFALTPAGLAIAVSAMTLTVGGVPSVFGPDKISFGVDGGELALSPAGLQHNGKNIGATHKHGGVSRGNGVTDTPE